MEFRLWLEKQRRTASKLGLYPALYSQYMNYPPQEVILWGADTITYMDPADIAFKAYDDKKFHPYFWHDKNM